MKRGTRMKIAFIITTFSIGGAQKVIIDLIEHMNREVYDIKVIIHSDPIVNQFTKRLDASKISYEFVHRDNKVSITSYKNLSRALIAFNPDVIHIHLDTLYAPLWVLLHNRRTVFTIHSQPYRLFGNKIIKIIFKKLLKRDNFYLTGVSKQIAAETAEILNVPEKKIVTIYNPVCLSGDEFEKKDRNEKEIVFVNVARFNPIKNQILLIDAFSKVIKVCQKTRLIFAGDGEMLEKCKEYSNRLAVSSAINFIGNVENVYSILTKADCFVLSSKSEALPISILEAMACSLPIIAPKVGGIPELVSENGILYETENCDQLVCAMIKMIKDNDYREYCAKKSYQLVEKFNPKYIVDQYEILYGTGR